MPNNLPPAVAAYFKGKNTRDIPLAVSGFADSAVVKDEHRDHVGPDAIGAWIKDSTAKYDDLITVQSAKTDGDSIVVLGEVAGTFPGSPILLGFQFTVQDNRIVRLAIAACKYGQAGELVRDALCHVGNFFL